MLTFIFGESLVNGNGVGISHVIRVIGIRYYKITENDEKANDQVHQFYTDDT